MKSRFWYWVLYLGLTLALAGCAVEVPGGIDDFSLATATPGAATATPVIIAPALGEAATHVPPPPTPTRAPTAARTPTQAPPPTGEQPTASSSVQATVTASVPAATATSQPSGPTPTAAGDTGETISIPGGTFNMGSTNGEADERPPHSVTVAAFAIDRFEVTNAFFDAFVKATGYQTGNEKNSKQQTWRTFSTPDTAGNPVVMVNWADAGAFCQWAGKRLPTEAEWEFAARGTDGRIYPWGNEYDPQKFNGKASGIHATVHVGSYPAGESAFGVDDMAGNVWEWTADWYQPYPGSTAKSPYFGEKFRVTRGGGWFDETNQVRASNRSSADPTAANDDLGFRCAK